MNFYYYSNNLQIPKIVLTSIKNRDKIAENNIRKALTEKSSLVGNIQREQHLVEAVYAEGRRKPFQSCNAQLSKRYRIPALKDRI